MTVHGAYAYHGNSIPTDPAQIMASAWNAVPPPSTATGTLVGTAPMPPPAASAAGWSVGGASSLHVTPGTTSQFFEGLRTSAGDYRGPSLQNTQAVIRQGLDTVNFAERTLNTAQSLYGDWKYGLGTFSPRRVAPPPGRAASGRGASQIVDLRACRMAGNAIGHCGP